MNDVHIRHSKPSDLEGIKAIFEQTHAYSNTLQLPYPSHAAWEERLAQKNRIGLVADFEGQIVGELGLEVNEGARRKHVATFGMGVAAEFTGKGIGSKLVAAALDLADNWLNVRRLEIEVYADNEPAIHLYKKFGFQVEGTCRDYAFRNGEYVDVLVMARIKPGDDR